MSASTALLAALAIIFTLPWLIWRLAGTDRHAPLVVIQIGLGVLLGPGVLGVAFPAFHAAIFTPATIASMSGLAAWGVMLFVWSAGVEIDVHEAWTRRRDTGITAGLALLVPLLFGLAAAALLTMQPGWTGPAGNRIQTMLGIGMACAVTAMPILVLFLDGLGILRQPLGRRVLRYASVDDVAIWGVLALILADWARLGEQALFLAVFVGASVLVRRLMPRLRENDRWYVALIWLLLCGFGADEAGFHFMIGAFLAGVVLDEKWLGQERMDRFRGVILLAVMPVFFLSTGLKTSWSVGGAAVFGAAALLLGASVIGKLAGVHLAGRWLGWARGEATVIGLLLQTKALIMIIFVNILLERGIVSSATFTALLLMALASTTLTMPLVRPRIARPG